VYKIKIKGKRQKVINKVKRNTMTITVGIAIKFLRNEKGLSLADSPFEININ
jgi:hypothetical protein